MQRLAGGGNWEGKERRTDWNGVLHRLIVNPETNTGLERKKWQMTGSSSSTQLLGLAINHRHSSSSSSSCKFFFPHLSFWPNPNPNPIPSARMIWSSFPAPYCFIHSFPILHSFRCPRHQLFSRVRTHFLLVQRQIMRELSFYLLFFYFFVCIFYIFD